MIHASLHCVLHYTRTRLGADADQSERQLLERFLACREEAAFAALLERHGPMVLSVCRRVLGDDHAAEDAFQATFLTLAHRAGALRKRDSLVSWLYGVAYRVSLQARAVAARRRACERQAQALRATAQATPREAPSPDLGPVLDEELARLPEKYRAPVVLCYLQGKTNEEAARLLGWPCGSVKGRLARARALLRARLIRRGLGPTAVLLGPELASTASASVPAGLAQATLRGLTPAGQEATAGAVPASVAALVEGALRPTAWARLKVALAALVVLAALTAGAAVLVEEKADTPAAPEQKKAEAVPPQKPPALAAEAPRLDADGDPLPPGARARLGTARFRHGGWIHGIAYSPDGKLLASGGAERAIYLWDADTGRLLRRLVGHRRYCQRIVFSPDGKLLASLGWEEEEIILWDPATGREVRRLRGHPGQNGFRGQTNSVAFTPDGKHLASTGLNGTTLLWDVATGQLVRRLPGLDRWPGAVAYSPDGKVLAQGGRGGVVYLWGAATDKEVRRLRPPGAGSTGAVTFSRDGQLLAVSAASGVSATVSVFDPTTGKLLRQWPDHEGYVYTLAFSPDGSKLAAHSYRSLNIRTPPCIRLWDVNTGREAMPLEQPWGVIHGVAFAPDGKVLAAADGGSIRRWDVATGKELSPRAGHRGGVVSLALAPDGKTVYTGGGDASLRAWDIATGRELFNLAGHDSAVICVRLSGDGKVLASAGNDSRLCLWDAPTGRLLRKAEERPGNYGIRAFALTPDGRTVVTASDGQGLRFWDVATWKEQRQFAKASMFFCLAFAPDGRTLGTGGYTGATGRQHVGLWEAATGRALGRDEGLSHITAVAFSPDGRHLVSGQDGYNNLVRLHAVPDGKVVRELRGHTQGVRDVAFSPDGRTVASAGHGGKVRLWEIATGQERRRLEGHRGAIHALAFAADGRTLVSGGDDTTVLVWDLADRVHAYRKGKAPTAAELERLWQELAGASVPRAYEAICRLTAFAEQSVPLLRGRLLALPAPGNRVAELIRHLDDRQFAVRERAMEELRKMGRQVEADLQKALAAAPTEEMRRRLERLLQGLGGPAEPWKDAEELRTMRALEVLEGAGTPAAREALEALARGRADSWLTREARASFQRLSRPPQ